MDSGAMVMEERYWIAVAAEMGVGRLPRRWIGAVRARLAAAVSRRMDEETMVAFLVGSSVGMEDTARWNGCVLERQSWNLYTSRVACV